MLLHDDDVDEFRRFYEAELGERLTPAEARDLATRILRLYALLARPLPSEHRAVLEEEGPTRKLKADD